METKRRLADYKIHPYTKQFDYFDKYISLHRQHQTDALVAARTCNKGQIISPCGTGKTRIQVSLHVEEMIRLNQELEYGVFVIASHRLSLNRQLLGELMDVAIQCGLPFDVLYLGSYKCDLSKYYAKYHHLGYKSAVSNHKASTNPNDIEKFIATARENFRHVIVASTYDSFAKLKNIGPINVVTFDEAHNTIQNDFTANVLEVKPSLQKEYFFTATRKVAGDDGGMNNEDFYGKVLFDVFPKLMLTRGEIVCPKLHVIDGKDAETTNTSNTEMLVKNTIEAYTKHKEQIKKDSVKPEEIGTKLLVACNSIEEMERIYDGKLLRAEKNVQAFAISSEGCYVNWVKSNKEEFFTKLNDLTDAEDAIIFNVDMLTEGIDLPSITGVMPLRNMSLTKLIQLLGRALRLHKTDRKNLYSGELIPGIYQGYVKPYGHLIIPRHLASVDDNPTMIKIVRLFYSEYGTKAEEIIIQEKFIDHQPQSLDTMIPYHFKDGKDYDLEHAEMPLIDDANLRLFQEDMAQLNAQQQIQYFERMFS